MAPIVIPTEATSPSSDSLSTPIIFIIAISCYIAAVIIFLIIRQIVVSRGFCAECNLFGKASETNDCCDCCIGIAQACDCRAPGVNTCCDSLCGPRKRCNVGDCLSCCNCGGCLPTDCCDCSNVSFCTCDGCQGNTPSCENIHCCCCVISCAQQQPGGYYPNQSYPNQGQQYPGSQGSFVNQGYPSTSLQRYPSQSYPTTQQPYSLSQQQTLRPYNQFQTSSIQETPRYTPRYSSSTSPRPLETGQPRRLPPLQPRPA